MAEDWWEWSSMLTQDDTCLVCVLIDFLRFGLRRPAGRGRMRDR